MRDAARKTAHGLQSLGLPELFFQVDPLRDIGGQDKTGRAFSEHYRMCGDFDIDDLAVLLGVAPRPRLVECVGWSRRVFKKLGNIFLCTNIFNSHPEELIARVAIAM